MPRRYAQKSAHLPVKTYEFLWRDTQTSPLHRMELNVSDIPCDTAADQQYRPRTVLQLHGIIENDAPPPRAPTPPAPVVPQAGPSRKRKAEVIDIDADEEDSDIKPDNKERIATRLSWLEVRLFLSKTVA
jgi:hypothetical protein